MTIGPDTNFKPRISLTDAMVDPRLFGDTFRQSTFWTWRTVAKLIDGLPLTESRETELFEECTGRKYATGSAYRRLVILCGRRGGKDRFASAVACWRSALAADWRKYQSAGEGAVCILIGADRKQARILRKYCEGLLAVPLLAREVVRNTAETIEFRNGSSLEIATNDEALVRGRSAVAVIGSECCHWQTDEMSSSSDEEVVSAAEKSLSMTIDGGLLLMQSSVHRKAGFMHRQFQKLHGNNQSSSLCWFAPSRTMNPKLPQRVIDEALAEDSTRARAEYLNIWREDSGDFIPLTDLEECTDWDVVEREPQRGTFYYAFCDISTGRGKDSAALCICHVENDSAKSLVVDLVRERRPRFVLNDVIAEWAGLLDNYGIPKIWSDGYAFGISADIWSRNGIINTKADSDTSTNYLCALPFLTSRRALLIDVETIRKQFAGLQRTVRGGYETVEHAKTASAHDDVAAAVAGCLVHAAKAAKNRLDPVAMKAILSKVAFRGAHRSGYQDSYQRASALESRMGERAYAMMTRGSRFRF